MARGRWLTGTVLILMGILFLAANTGYIAVTVGDILSFWPLIIIVVGILMLFRSRRGAPLGIIALVVLAGAVIWYGQDTNWNLDRMLEYRGGSAAEQQSFKVPFKGSSRTARFQLDAGAGSMTLTGGASFDQLLSVETQSVWGSYSLDQLQDSNFEESWHLRQDVRPGRGLFSFGGNQNKATIKLNPTPDWDIVANVGAADLNLDWTSLSVTNARIESGASNMTIRLGDWQQHCTVTVKTGASSLTVYVPRSSKVTIREDSGLSSRDYQDFSKTGDKTYASTGTDQALNSIDLTINAGVSSVKVVRY